MFQFVKCEAIFNRKKKEFSFIGINVYRLVFLGCPTEKKKKNLRLMHL